MNIQQAKQEILNTLRAYLQKDAQGEYCFPMVRQRPLLLMGPPGVGKTAVVEQAARETGIPLVAYTVTHHTRQSAVGLPKIAERDYCGLHFSVTEYTMSEIIGAVYEAMDRTGKREGILFLDEINCVSETLAPTMLQFLQNKTFGNHRLPEGWVIIAAGNPPEYNKSVRDFDIVTLDRIRNIPVEASVEAFLSYGTERKLHGAVLSYLALKPENFYHVSRDENSLHYVTARGWEDLSRLLQSYESLGFPVDEDLMGEFLNLEKTSRDFGDYYRLYAKYGRDYGVREILAGEADEALLADRQAMARAGDFTERFALVNLVLEQLRRYAAAYTGADARTVALHETLQTLFRQTAGAEDFLKSRRAALETKQQFRLEDANALSGQEQVLRTLERWCLEAKEAHRGEGTALEVFLKERFEEQLKDRKKEIIRTAGAIDRAIAFLSACFGDGQELTLLITGMTGCKELMAFIARHGSDSYLQLSGRLQCQKNEETLRQLCRQAQNRQ